MGQNSVKIGTLKEVIWPKKNFELHAWIHKCQFGNFSERVAHFLSFISKNRVASNPEIP